MGTSKRAGCGFGVSLPGWCPGLQLEVFELYNKIVPFKGYFRVPKYIYTV